MDTNAGDWTEDDWEKLRRYALGELAAPQARALEVWLAADPQRARVAENVLRHWAVAQGLGTQMSLLNKQDALKEVLRRVSPSPSRLETERLFGRIRPPSKAAGAAVAQRGSRPALHFFSSSRKSHWYLGAVGLGIAAALVLWSVGVGISRTSAARRSTLDYATGPGQRSRITLDDGSKVLLAPASRLTVTVSAAQDHVLTLVGEALFDVVHDPRRSYRVSAGNGLVEDIGTRFVVRAYPTDLSVRVAVTEGAVALRAVSSGTRRILSRGAVGSVTGGGETVLNAAGDFEALVAWQNGQLVFSQTQLAQALADVARWYDVEVQLADTSLARLPVSGSLPTTSVKSALNAIGSVVGMRWEQHGRLVTFFATPHTHPTPARRSVATP